MRSRHLVQGATRRAAHRFSGFLRRRADERDPRAADQELSWLWRTALLAHALSVQPIGLRAQSLLENPADTTRVITCSLQEATRRRASRRGPGVPQTRHRACHPPGTALTSTGVPL